MSLAFVLSGGGASGDFEVGAIELFIARGFHPDIVVGTSVGALNASKLAEGEGAPTQGSRGLRQTWLSLLYDSDMWSPEPWLSQVDIRFQRAILNGGMPAIAGPPGMGIAWGDLDRLVFVLQQAEFLIGDGAAILTALGQLLAARSIFNLDPIAARAQILLTPSLIQSWAATGKKLRLVTVNLETGKLRHITETGEVVEADQTTPVLFIQSMTPAVQSAQTQVNSLESDIASLQAELRAAAPGDKQGLAAQIKSLRLQLATAKAALTAAEQQAGLVPLKVSIASGAIASSSIGTVFRPALLGDSYYVDGGHRRPFPIQTAVDLKADTIFGVIATPPFMDAPSLEDPGPRPESFAQKAILDIAVRSILDIPNDQLMQDNRQPAAGFQGTLHTVFPTFGLHNLLTIDPGLIRINADYGFMRAADTLDGVSPTSATGQLVDQIIMTRGQLWRAECVLFGKPIPTAPDVDTSTPQPAGYSALRDLAASLVTLVNQRKTSNHQLPDRSVNWGATWEKHPWLVQTVAPVTAVSHVADNILVTGITNEGVANGRLMFSTASNGAAFAGWNALEFAYNPSNTFVGTTAVDQNAAISYIGSDGWVYIKWRDAFFNFVPWWVVGSSNAPALNGSHGGAIHGVSAQSGMLHLFYTDNQGRPIVARMDNAPNGTWGEHKALPAATTIAGGHITAVSRRPGQVDIFMVQNDGAVYTAAWNAQQGWQGWWKLGGISAYPGTMVGAVSAATDNLDIFVTDTSGRTMTTSWKPGANWAAWSQVQAGVINPGAVITAVSRAPGFIDLFTTSKNGQIITAARDSTNKWGGWWSVGGAISGSIVWPVSRSANKLDIFYVSPSDQTVYTASWQPGNAAWVGPTIISQRWDLTA